MDEREPSVDDPFDDDPFADVAPPDWDELPSHDEVLAIPTGRPSPPTVSDDEVTAPPLPPPVGGPEETEWSVRGAADPELASFVGGAAATSLSTVAPPAAEPVEVEPEETHLAAIPIEESPGDFEAPLEIPPEFWGERPVEPEPEDEPIIDLSTRDTAGLLSNIGGVVLWVAGLGAAWYFLTRQPDPIIEPRNWPTPEDTWDALVGLAESDDARTTVRETGQRLLAALVAGSAVGLIIGSITGRRRIVRNLLRPALAVFRIVSPLVLLYFLFVWGETGWWVSWAPAAVGVAALTTWSTDRALSKPPPRLTTVSGPEVVRGLRASTLLAWTLVFATELALDLDGIFPTLASSAGSMPVAVAWLVVAAALALLVEGALRILERLVARG